MSNSHHSPNRRQLSPLAADIEAEFGHLRRVTTIGPRMSAAQLHALSTSISEASAAVPKAIRGSFHRNCLERLRNHFGLEYRNLAANQFGEAVSVVSSHIEETRRKIDRMSIEIPKADNRRWRVKMISYSEDGPNGT